jgi:hypothetical protein
MSSKSQSKSKLRPTSFSESDIHLPRFSNFSIQEPLLLNLPASPPSDLNPITPKKEGWIPLLHYWALRFSFHLSLISLFETIFFWNFISKSEDQALINVINGYTSGIVSSCRNLTAPDKNIVTGLIALFLNQTTAVAEATAAIDRRNAFNGILIRNSWIYFGGITTLFAILSVSNYLYKNDVNWRNLILENLTLVSLLGLYEWMFFSTIVLKYQSISIQELDGLVVNELLAAC